MRVRCTPSSTGASLTRGSSRPTICTALVGHCSRQVASSSSSAAGAATGSCGSALSAATPSSRVASAGTDSGAGSLVAGTSSRCRRLFRRGAAVSTSVSTSAATVTPASAAGVPAPDPSGVVATDSARAVTAVSSIAAPPASPAGLSAPGGAGGASSAAASGRAASVPGETAVAGTPATGAPSTPSRSATSASGAVRDPSSAPGASALSGAGAAPSTPRSSGIRFESIMCTPFLVSGRLLAGPHRLRTLLPAEDDVQVEQMCLAQRFSLLPGRPAEGDALHEALLLRRQIHEGLHHLAHPRPDHQRRPGIGRDRTLDGGPEIAQVHIPKRACQRDDRLPCRFWAAVSRLLKPPDRAAMDPAVSRQFRLGPPTEFAQ